MTTKKDKLAIAREEINAVDREMAKLFERRMNAVKMVGEYKKERGLPILDPEREKIVLEKNAKMVKDPEIRSYFVNFLEKEMELSRNMQSKMLEGCKVAYSGVPGAFAYEAVTAMFPEGLPISCPDFKDAYSMVAEGKADYAVLPFENSYAGEVGTVIDLLFTGSLYINRVQGIPVKQNLLVVPGAKVSDITQVVSHPQALAQCADFIRNHGFETKDFSNTALAAKYVAERQRPYMACIAGESAAEIYGLEVAVRGINEQDNNTTRFAVVSRTEAKRSGKKDDCFFLTFTVKDKAGAISEALNIIAKYGYNMRGLHSRPMKTLTWHYYFYIEGEGDIRTRDGQYMLKELERCCDKLRLIGSYANR